MEERSKSARCYSGKEWVCLSISHNTTHTPGERAQKDRLTRITHALDRVYELSLIYRMMGWEGMVRA